MNMAEVTTQVVRECEVGGNEHSAVFRTVLIRIRLWMLFVRPRE